MRGQHGYRVWFPTRIVGSSPHARGTLGLYEQLSPLGRFIPACAGNTIRLVIRRVPSLVHPRMRGEHSPITIRAGASAGSSPHARGTRDRDTSWGRLARFIPACAGNTPGPQSAAHQASVHPRMRGEHIDHGVDDRLVDGSSPHARGTRAAGWQRTHLHRFIPACAGNTPGRLAGQTPWSVHPRMRGEHSPNMAPYAMPAGSSPHARGTRSRHGGPCSRRTVHPRMRGEHVSRSARTPSRTVHPRMRGEHWTTP